MPALLPPLRLTGALVLRDGALQRRSIAFAAGRLTRGPLPEVDLSGYLVMPGIVDAHAPLPPGPFETTTLDPAAAAGVTTSVVVLPWGWRGGPRAATMAEAAMARIAALRPRLAPDVRLHLLAEATAVRDEARLIAAAGRRHLHGVVFADSRVEPHSLPEDLRAAYVAAQRDRRDVPRHLCRLAEALDALALPYGSHSDPDGETRERHSMIGARIAVFPATRSAAVAAHAMMSPVILSAPRLLAGDRVTAGLIAEGVCDALASEGEPASLARAAALLAPDLGWPKAWGLISSGPAEVLRMADRGRLDSGARADLTVVHAESGAVEATICAGRLTWLSGEAARRFRAQAFAAPLLSRTLPPPMAAE